MAEPTPAGQHRRQQDDNHDQIDTEDGERRI
jgi:hypothetical protein